MAIESTVTETAKSKAVNVTAYLGTLQENAAWGADALSNASVRLTYQKHFAGVNTEAETVVTVADIEAAFPGFVAMMTSIANHYSPYK